MHGGAQPATRVSDPERPALSGARVAGPVVRIGARPRVWGSGLAAGVRVGAPGGDTPHRDPTRGSEAEPQALSSGTCGAPASRGGCPHLARMLLSRE